MKDLEQSQAYELIVLRDYPFDNLTQFVEWLVID